jgi:hypothetical protein
METIEGIERELESPNENPNAPAVKVVTAVLGGVEDAVEVIENPKDSIEHVFDDVVGKIGIPGHGV